jgi:hypothetical protein
VREFRDRDAALAVGLAYALYPVAIRTSLEVLAQAPFSLCLALGLLRCRRRVSLTRPGGRPPRRV